MSVYKTGTVSINNGSTTLSGTGTSFVSAGIGPGSVLHIGSFSSPVASVTNATTIVLDIPYTGTNLSDVPYAIVTSNAILSDTLVALQTLVTDFQDVRDEAGEGLFGDGTEAAPGVRFLSDPDTGIYRSAANEVSVSVGGARQLTIDATEVSGPLVQSTSADVSGAKKLVRVDGALAASLSHYGEYFNAAENEDIDAAQAGDVGLYSVDGAGTYPANAVGFVWVETQAIFSGDAVVQRAFRYTGSAAAPPRHWVRLRSNVNNVWSDWAEVFSQVSILGGVSQSAGVPTGAVIERGSNASGDYVRFADGTQICTVTRSLGSITSKGSGTAGDPYRTDPADGNWPAAFITTPNVTVNPVPPSDNFSLAQYFSIGMVRRVTNDSYFTVSVVRPAGQSTTSVDFDIQITAIGRWF